MSNNLILNRLFTQNVFRDLLFNQVNEVYSLVANRYIEEIQYASNKRIIKEIYDYMSRNYRNEYFYQNTLFNKLLLGRHSLNTTTALSQIPVGKSKADFVMINGKATVYEIKTELDSFERLENQIRDYYKAFDHVCVVTGEKQYEKLKAQLDSESVGIYVLSKKNTLRFLKEPKEHSLDLSSVAIFKILRKKEFEDIIKRYYGELPTVSPAFYYDECFELLSRIPMMELYPMFLAQLKLRKNIIKERYDNVPYELKSLMYFFNAKEKDYADLESFLKNDYRG